MCLFKECRSIRKFGLIQDYYRESQLEIRKKCTFSFYFIVRGKCQYGEGLLKLGCHSVKTVLRMRSRSLSHYSSLFCTEISSRWNKKMRETIFTQTETLCWIWIIFPGFKTKAQGWGRGLCDLLTQTKLFMIKCYKNIGSYQLGWPYLHTVLQNV